ncbi:MAG: FAD-dependent thymidylate synthase [Deltaproteobacteria bacterium]|nr:FAD-dependent thymidylate synthase [Deltaproteobacteria bacterium]
MKIIDQSWEWVQKPAAPLEVIERAGRTCYKSEGAIGPGSAEKFARMLVRSGHESVIEHAVASIRFITNRGVTHELVRHRLSSFSQESTRYVRYKDRMEFIRPVWWNEWSQEERDIWEDAMSQAESAYKFLLKQGSRPEQAREVLPNSLKTEIVMTANLREWRSVFSLRCAKGAHPQIRVLMLECLQGFAEEIPIIFDDLAEKYVSFRKEG